MLNEIPCFTIIPKAKSKSFFNFSQVHRLIKIGL